MTPPKKIGTIQVDLDALWTNLEYYGHQSEISPDALFASSIPRFLDLFAKYNIKATFFLVGKDGESKEKMELIRRISKAGHEIANHTYSHVFGFRKLSNEEKIKEISKSEEIIYNIIGKKPCGFKTPGFDFDLETLNILRQRGYLYDSSIIPTPVYPLILRMNRLLFGGEKRTHGPKLSWVFAPHKLYYPSLGSIIKKATEADGEKTKGSTKEAKSSTEKEGSNEQRKIQLKEVPCSVMPLLRLPFHPTFAAKFGLPYFNLAFKLNNYFSSYLNYAFHAADLADDLTDPRLGHLSKVSFQKRFYLCEEIIKKISQKYEIVTTKELVERSLVEGGL